MELLVHTLGGLGACAQDFSMQDTFCGLSPVPFYLFLFVCMCGVCTCICARAHMWVRLTTSFHLYMGSEIILRLSARSLPSPLDGPV